MKNDTKMKIRTSLLGLIITIAITILGLVIGIVPSAYADSPCLHGMRIVGDESIYLSHMGLFNDNCHDYQGIFEVAFTGENDPKQKYLDTQRSDPDKNEFTLRPQGNFVLPDLGSGKIKSFQADLFEGQYERSQTQPKKIAANVTVTVKRVLHFRFFNRSATLPPNLEYLLFGSSKEQYVAHKLTRPNDFDQILAVKSPIPLSDIELSKALPIVFIDKLTQDETAMLNSALKSNEPLSVKVNSKGVNQTLEVGTQYFKEICDYKNNPPDPADCP